MRHGLTTAIGSLCLLITGALAPATPSHASPATATAACAASAATTPVPSDVSERHPVVVVHGWTGSAAGMQDTVAGLADRLGEDYAVYAYDYSARATTWAGRPDVSACLAAYLRGLSEANQAAGGDGGVEVVAHSMGGLATLFASDPTTQTKPADASVLTGVVTLSTPYLGSPFGGTWLADLKSGLANPARAWDEWWSRKYLPVKFSDAARCLTRQDPPHQLPPSCPAPPALAESVPLTMVAGDNIVKRTLFGRSLYEMDLRTDGIVPVDSASGYLSSRYPTVGQRHVDFQTVTCTTTSDQTLALLRSMRGNIATSIITAEVKALGLLWHDSRVLDQVLAAQPGVELEVMSLTTVLTSPCGHSLIVKNDEALDIAADAIRTHRSAWPGASPDAVPTPSGDPTVSSPWPVSRRDGKPALYAWLGANMIGMPDWMACEPKGVWCIGAFGDQVHLINQAELVDVGTIPLSTARPAAALHRLGVDDRAARALLADAAKPS